VRRDATAATGTAAKGYIPVLWKRTALRYRTALRVVRKDWASCSLSAFQVSGCSEREGGRRRGGGEGTTRSQRSSVIQRIRIVNRLPRALLTFLCPISTAGAASCNLFPPKLPLMEPRNDGDVRRALCLQRTGRAVFARVTDGMMIMDVKMEGKERDFIQRRGRERRSRILQSPPASVQHCVCLIAAPGRSDLQTVSAKYSVKLHDLGKCIV
jgi:hypothetical protein